MPGHQCGLKALQVSHRHRVENHWSITYRYLKGLHWQITSLLSLTSFSSGQNGRAMVNDSHNNEQWTQRNQVCSQGGGKKKSKKQDSIRMKRKIQSWNLKKPSSTHMYLYKMHTHHVFFVPPATPKEQIFKQITIHWHVCPKCQEWNAKGILSNICEWFCRIHHCSYAFTLKKKDQSRITIHPNEVIIFLSY